MTVRVPACSLLRLRGPGVDVDMFTVTEACAADLHQLTSLEVMTADDLSAAVAGTVELVTDTGIHWTTGRYDPGTGVLNLTGPPITAVLERRGTHRTPLTLPVFGTAQLATAWSRPQPRVRLRGHTLDISTAGLLARVSPIDGLRFGARLAAVFLELRLPDDSIAVGLEVAEQRADLLRGTFSYLSTEAGRALAALLADAAGQ